MHSTSVLILVLLGCGLLGYFTLGPIAICVVVLILVLLGCGLLDYERDNLKNNINWGLNPCFVGMWSFS